MYKHVLLAVCLIGIPFVYAQENSEIRCDIPDPKGSCYKPLQADDQSLQQGSDSYHMGYTTEASITGINFGFPLIVTVGAVGSVVVVLVLKKRKQTR